MNLKEAELVIISDETYNLCPGGNGGFGYINNEIELRKAKNSKARRVTNSIYSNKLSEWSSKGGRSNFEKNGANKGFLEAGKTSFLGKKHTEETKAKISEKAILRVGSLSSQFGSMWITNGTENKKIKSIDSIPEGWYKGRKVNRV